MDKIFSPIKRRIFEYIDYKCIYKVDFYNKTSLSPSNFKGKAAESELGGEKIAKILTVYNDLNPEWLLTGKLPMLREVPCRITVNPDTLLVTNKLLHHGSFAQIPLLTQTAAAKFGSENFSIQKEDVKAHYMIPMFNDKRVDFMIEVSGSSMYPKFNSGDIIACSIIKESNFIQWNKVYVIATKEQGLLVKHIKENDDNSIIAVSDNPDYPPFVIPKVEITGIAMVVGVIKIE